MRYFSFLIRLCLCAVAVSYGATAVAQQYSFIYIQGDKNVPFYVKLEGEMMPRYGKNYCIIPRLEPGEINVDILFQQNQFPEEHFILKVPENSARSFMLTLKDGAYALYDLQQNFYLPPGNQAIDDFLSAPLLNGTTTAQEESPKEPATIPVAKTEVPKPQKIRSEPRASIFKPEKPATQPVASNGEPRFLDDIAFHNNSGEEGMITTTATHTASRPQQSTAIGQKKDIVIVTNSDCPEPLSDDDFQRLYSKAQQEGGEESRLGYLIGKADNCYSRNQVKQLAALLTTDAAKYTLLKKYYPRTSDQAGYADLQDVFESSQWKAYFREIL